MGIQFGQKNIPKYVIDVKFSAEHDGPSRIFLKPQRSWPKPLMTSISPSKIDFLHLKLGKLAQVKGTLTWSNIAEAYSKIWNIKVDEKTFNFSTGKNLLVL